MAFRAKLFSLLKKRRFTVNRSFSIANRNPDSHICGAGLEVGEYFQNWEYFNGPVIGIDFGLKKSRVGVMTGNVPKVLENKKKMKTTSSIGLTWIELKRLAQNACYNSTAKILENLHANLLMEDIADHFETDLRVFKPNVNYISYQSPFSIMAEMKNTAEMFLKTKVHNAVIAIPPYYDTNDNRTKMKLACKKIGIKHISILPKPCLTVLVSGLPKSDYNEVFAVCDLGVEFEVSIVERGERFLEYSSMGDRLLGEEDFDYVLLNYFKESFRKQNGIDLSRNNPALQKLLAAAVDAKKQLSEVTEVEIYVPNLAIDPAGKSKDFQILFTREKFENLVDQLLERVVKLCQMAVNSTEKNKSVNKVILVGGMTKMPKIKKIIEQYFDQQVQFGINPDEAAAIGATIQGTILSPILTL